MPEHPGSSSVHRFFSLSSSSKLIFPESTQREVTVSVEPTVFLVRYPPGVCLLGEDGRDDEQAINRQGSWGGVALENYPRYTHRQVMTSRFALHPRTKRLSF